MQVNASCRLHHAPEFHEARGHHHEIGQHVAFAEESPERLQAIRDSPSRLTISAKTDSLSWFHVQVSEKA